MQPSAGVPKPVDVGTAGNPGIVLANLMAALQWINGEKQAQRAARRRQPLNDWKEYMLR
jgi:hypothetical protein